MVQVTKTNRIYLSPPHLSGTEMKYIEEALASNWIAPLGPNVDAFEEEIANLLGVSGAVAVSSGTAAIHLALSLLDVGKGDTVFCSSLTFVASANPILYLGAEPVFIDSEPESWNMSPQALENAFIDAAEKGTMPKAVVIVNLYGQPAKMEELSAICRRYGVPIVEDAAESLGSRYKGRMSGTFGEFGIFSFNGNKIITSSGGGMLVSDNLEALRRARFLATQARDAAPYYQHSVMGYNYRMSNILAGLGRSQLNVLQERIEGRRMVYEIYRRELALIPEISLMPELNSTFSNRWLTALTIKGDSSGKVILELLDKFNEENIEARHVWKPLHLQPLFEKNKYFQHSEKTSISNLLFHTGLCLPSGTKMTLEDQMRVIECIKEIML